MTLVCLIWGFVPRALGEFNSLGLDSVGKEFLIVLLEGIRLRKSLRTALPQTLRHAAAAIGIIAIDTDGTITYINQPGVELVQEFIGRERLPRNLIGQIYLCLRRFAKSRPLGLPSISA